MNLNWIVFFYFSWDKMKFQLFFKEITFLHFETGWHYGVCETFLPSLSAISHWKVAAPLCNPNGMHLNWKCLMEVIKAVCGLLCSSMATCQNPTGKSKELNQEVQPWLKKTRFTTRLHLPYIEITRCCSKFFSVSF